MDGGDRRRRRLSTAWAVAAWSLPSSLSSVETAMGPNRHRGGSRS
jgi:hypothetical protein